MRRVGGERVVARRAVEGGRPVDEEGGGEPRRRGPAVGGDKGEVGAVRDDGDVVRVVHEVAVEPRAAVEEIRRADAAVERVVARAAGQRVRAGPAELRVVALPPVQGVRARAAPQAVAPRVAGQDVVAAAADQALDRRERVLAAARPRRKAGGPAGCERGVDRAGVVAVIGDVEAGPSLKPVCARAGREPVVAAEAEERVGAPAAPEGVVGAVAGQPVAAAGADGVLDPPRGDEQVVPQGPVGAGGHLGVRRPGGEVHRDRQARRRQVERVGAVAAGEEEDRGGPAPGGRRAVGVGPGRGDRRDGRGQDEAVVARATEHVERQRRRERGAPGQGEGVGEGRAERVLDGDQRVGPSRPGRRPAVPIHENPALRPAVVGGVEAAAAVERVEAGAADQHVVAVAAEQRVVAQPADQGVAARPAVEAVRAGVAQQGVVAFAPRDVLDGKERVGAVRAEGGSALEVDGHAPRGGGVKGGVAPLPPVQRVHALAAAQGVVAAEPEQAVAAVAAQQRVRAGERKHRAVGRGEAQPAAARLEGEQRRAASAAQLDQPHRAAGEAGAGEGDARPLEAEDDALRGEALAAQPCRGDDGHGDPGALRQRHARGEARVGRGEKPPEVGAEGRGNGHEGHAATPAVLGCR